jgi:Spy/CpxP family protein refolding chaperone
MNKLFLIAAAIAASLFTLSSPALLARETSRPDAQPHKWSPRQIKAELGLSDEQMAKIKTEFHAQKGPLKEQSQHVKAARANLRQAIQSGAPEAELRAAAATLGSAEGDLAVVRAALFARIKPILTPEQLAKFQELQASR